MAHVIDTRNAGGELVILGDALTLPSSSHDSNPLQGSMRFNPLISVVEYFNPGIQQWVGFATGPQTASANAVAVRAVLVAKVTQLLANPQPIGSPAFASDGRKPSEYTYAFEGRVAKPATGTGVPVFYGFPANDGTSATLSTWVSAMDGLPVQS